MYSDTFQHMWALIPRYQAPAPGETVATVGNTRSGRSLRFERSDSVLDAPHARRSNPRDVMSVVASPITVPSSAYYWLGRQSSGNPFAGPILPSGSPTLAGRHRNARTASSSIRNANAVNKPPPRRVNSGRLSEPSHEYCERLAQHCVDSDVLLTLCIKRYTDKEVSPRELDAIMCCMLARVDAMLVEHNPDNRRFHRLRRALVKLCVATKTPPSALFEDGVITHVTESEAWGGYGRISSGFLGNRKIALKQLFVNRKAEPQKAQTALYREVLVWTTLCHPSILPLLGLVPGTNEMICPWMANGDLRTYIERHRGDMKLGLKQTWILQIASGLAYLHANRVVHGDFHGGNILLDENMHVQISDFGLTTLVDAGKTTMGISKFASGALPFMAPEVLEPGTRCTQAADVYSFACLCFQIVTEQPPWRKCRRIEQVLCAIATSSLSWPHVVDVALDGLRPLMERCWSRDPDARPQMWEVLSQVQTLFAASPQ